MAFVVAVLGLLGVHAQALDSACDAEQSSDQHSLLMVQTAVGVGSALSKAFSRRQDTYHAVCFDGELRYVNETRKLLRTNLLDVLSSEGAKVDVFVAAPTHGPFTPTDLEIPFRKHENGESHAVAIRNFSYKEELSNKSVEEIVLSAPEKAVELYKTGKFLLGPWNARDNTMRIYNHEQDCLEMMRQAETNLQFRYQWIIKSRPDFMWITPHPPLSVMDPDMFWSFDTERYLFMNDRHVVGGRDQMFKAFLNKLNMIMTGDPVIYKPAVANGNSYGGLGDEAFAKLVADGNNVHVALMPTVAYLTLCPSWSPLCTRYDHTLYPNEVNHAKANQASWSKSKSCWVRTSHDRINISHSCPPL